MTYVAAVVTGVAVAGITAGLWANSGGPAPNGPTAAKSAAAGRVARDAGQDRAGTQQQQMAAAANRAQARGAAARPATAQRPADAASQLQTLDNTGKQYQFYDSVIPSAIPAGGIAAVYATGPFAASPSAVASRSKVMWIDVTGSDPQASALDTEPSDATPQQAATWAWNRLHQYPHALARIYTMRAEWPQVQALVASYPANIRARIRWWIADPTGYPHMVPGADATQWYWGSGYDESTANPNF